MPVRVAGIYGDHADEDRTMLRQLAEDFAAAVAIGLFLATVFIWGGHLTGAL